MTRTDRAKLPTHRFCYGAKFEMIIEENEGHGFGSETNRFNLFRKIDQFLKANLY